MSEGGILTGPEIRSAIYAGDIEIDPLIGLEEGQFINPASYDLTLGNQVAVYSAVTQIVHGSIPLAKYDVELGEQHRKLVKQEAGTCLYAHNERCLDAREQNKVWNFTIDPKRGWVLKPGIGYLMHTAERVTTKRYVPVLDGKSSIGRLFITAHVTAGYGDPGFDGQYTLEVVTTHPVLVYPGMRFCQMRFHVMSGEPLIYKGNYTKEYSMGPVPSRSWRQFEEKFTDTPIVGFAKIATGINAAVDRGDLPSADPNSESQETRPPPRSGRGCHNG